MSSDEGSYFEREFGRDSPLIGLNEIVPIKETISVWRSRHFPELPLRNWGGDEAEAKELFSHTLVNLGAIDEIKKTKRAYSVVFQGRTIVLEPFIFKDNDEKKYAFLLVKGVGKTTTDVDQRPPLAEDKGSINPAFSRLRHYGEEEDSVRGAAMLEPALSDKDFSEYLISLGFETARPVMILKRKDPYAQQIQDDPFLKEFQAGIYARAFTSCFRLNHLQPSNLDSETRRLVLEHEKKVLRLRGFAVHTDQDFFNHFFNVFAKNIDIMHRDRVCYHNWITSNICANGEVVDFDDAAVYAVDDKTVALYSGIPGEEINYARPVDAWSIHFNYLIRIFERLYEVAAEFVSEKYAHERLNKVITEMFNTSFTENQRRGLKKALSDIEASEKQGVIEGLKQMRVGEVVQRCQGNLDKN